MQLRISKVATISTGYQSRTAFQGEEHGTHFLLQIRDFDQDRTRIALDGMIRFTPSPSSRDQPLRRDEVVFLSRGQKNFAFALPELPAPIFAGPYFFVLRPNSTILGPYLAWCLNQPPALRHFRRFGTTGAHMSVVTRDVLESLVIPVPELDTQRRIVELEALAATQGKLLAELAKKKRAIANAACMRAAFL